MRKETKNKILIYKPKGKAIEIEVKLERGSIWLDAHQMAELFGVNRPAIVKHINNIYKTGELNKKSTCSILEQAAADGKIRKMNLFNLDMIIAVGYRVNSFRATQFRIWATTTLRKYLKNGYILNEKKLTAKKIKEIQKSVDFIKRKMKTEVLSVSEVEGQPINLLINFMSFEFENMKGE